MSEPSRTDEIADLVAETFQIDRAKIRPDSRLIDFGVDSARAMELIVRLETVHALSIPDRDLPDLMTLEDIARYLEKRKRTS